MNIYSIKEKAAVILHQQYKHRTHKSVLCIKKSVQETLRMTREGNTTQQKDKATQKTCPEQLFSQLALVHTTFALLKQLSMHQICHHACKVHVILQCMSNTCKQEKSSYTANTSLLCYWKRNLRDNTHYILCTSFDSSFERTLREGLEIHVRNTHTYSAHTSSTSIVLNNFGLYCPSS